MSNYQCMPYIYRSSVFALFLKKQCDGFGSYMSSSWNSLSVACCLSCLTSDWLPALDSQERERKICHFLHELNMLRRNSIISRVVIQLSLWSGKLANWNIAPAMMQCMIVYWDSSIALRKGIRCTVSVLAINVCQVFLPSLFLPSAEPSQQFVQLACCLECGLSPRLWSYNSLTALRHHS